MNIHRIQEYLLRWGVTIFGIVLALYLVHNAGTGSYGKVALVFAASTALFLLLTMRQGIWVLLPITWSLMGTLPSLDIPFAFRDLVVIGVFGAMITFRAFKVIARKIPWSKEDSIALAMVLYMGICWIRNPVGVAALDSDRVGGRPYFNIIIGMLACWAISQCSIPGKRATLLLVAITLGQMIEGIIGQLIYWFPPLGSIIEPLYMSGVFLWAQQPDQFVQGTPVGEGLERLGYLSSIGIPLGYFVFSYFRPFGLLNLFRFYRILLFVSALACVAMSGFRSALGALMIAGVFSAYYWGGKQDLLKVGVAAMASLTIVVVGNGSLYELPFSVQRALSFLPGKWDYQAISAAKESTRWRTEMWDAMLKDNRYVENKVLGDGFGFKKRDLALIQYFQEYGDSTDGQESYLITGNVHSGPISAIRYAGYVGVVMILALQIALARKAWRLMFLARQTRFRHLGFFITFPIVLEPIFFNFIYGAFEGAIPAALFNLGMLHMLENSLADEEGRNAALKELAGKIPGPEAEQALLPLNV